MKITIFVDTKPLHFGEIKSKIMNTYVLLITYFDIPYSLSNATDGITG